MNHPGELRRNDWIAIVREERLAANLIVAKGHMEGLFDSTRGRLHVDDQPIRIAPGDGQSLGLSPIDDGLLVLRGGREARVPLLVREEVVKLRRVSVMQRLYELLFFLQVGRTQHDGQSEHLSGIERAGEGRAAFGDGVRSLSAQA